VFVGAVSVAWQQAHVRIDLFLNFAPPRWRRLLEIFSNLVLAAILVPVVLASFRFVDLLFNFGQRSYALRLPMWIPQGIIPVSLLLIVVMSLLRIFVHLTDEDSEAGNDHV
jgi:TRAP-type C4-dicarboxylate transport system permease small subunit